MKRLSSASRRRRGAVLPLTALLVVFLIALIALGVDMGYIITVRTQMQSAADAAALAGAAKLLDTSYLQGTGNVGTASNTAMGNARTAAQTFAHSNSGGGVALTLDANSSNTAGGDIVCGYIATPTNYNDAMVTTVTDVGPYPNSVQVQVHRDAVRNGSLSLFFAPVLGIKFFNLDAKATATYQQGISGFQIVAPGYDTVKVLPFALDINTWNSVVAGNGPDVFTRTVNAATGQASISSGSDGIHETKLYPLSNGNGSGNSGLPPGNFGTVDIGAANNSTADISRQIRYGINATDLSYLPGGKLQLDSTTQTLTLQGDTGVSAGVKDDLAAIIGQPRILPLYSSVSGPGNNANYTIVGFAGITITEVVLTGSLSSKHITIQPCWCIEPNALGGGNGTTSTFVVKPLALTR